MPTLKLKLVLLCATLFAAACGGVTPEPASVDQEPAAQEPAVTVWEQFRAGYSNPGGMWMPSQMTLSQHRDNFERMGVAIPAEQLANPLADPLAAIVSLGGCSASFVSPNGLVVTNHHCVQGALQQNSTPENNLVENGFLAKDMASELSAGPANRIMVAKAFKDVTKEMRDGLDKVGDPVKRKEENENREKKLVARCEKDRPGIRCSVSSFFNGAEYKLIEYLEIRDVRLVYVPHRSVGNFGGEIDNWAWPRHTGDFSFYRAYVGPDGKPADFSPNNVPYKPDHYLRISTEGVAKGDFVMVVGYPGRTERLATAEEVRHDVEWFYPYLIDYLKERYDITEKLLGSEDKNTALKAGTFKQFAQNGLEMYQGMLSGLTKGDLLDRKAALDAKVKAWAAEPGREATKTDIEKMEQILAEERKTERVDFDRMLAFNGSRLLSNTISLVRMAEERPKKDEDRKPGYQDRDMTNMVAREMAFANMYDRTLDRELFKLTLMRAAKLPEEDRPWLRLMLGIKKNKAVDEAAIDAALAKMYEGTGLEKQEVRIDILKNGTMATLKASKDPFVKAALAIWPTFKAEEEKSDARHGELLLVRPAYAAAMREVLGGFLSPDANSTLRITYGTVKSFKPDPAEEADWPFTTAAQILKKNTGEEPFDSPVKLLEGIKAKAYGPYARDDLGGELPVDFLSDLDITGGNSGSATLNDKGELVGLAFDGTTDGVASDVVFNGETTRTIHADVRYMLWVMDAIDQADWLIREMGVTPSL